MTPTQKSNKDKIEKLQRRAARFVSINFRRKASVSEMLHDLGWQSLDGRRQDQRVYSSFFTKLLTDSRRLKRIGTSSRQSTPEQGRITASNSNTSKEQELAIETKNQKKQIKYMLNIMEKKQTN